MCVYISFCFIIAGHYFEATFFLLIPQSVPDVSGSIITITLVNMLVSHLSKVFNSVLMTVCAALSRIPQVRRRTPVCGRQRNQTHPNHSPALLGSETFSTVPCPTALATLFDEGVEKQRVTRLSSGVYFLCNYSQLPVFAKGDFHRFRAAEQISCDPRVSVWPSFILIQKNLLQKPMCFQN